MGFKVFSVNELVQEPACIEDNEHSVYIGNAAFPDEAIIEEIEVSRN